MVPLDPIEARLQAAVDRLSPGGGEVAVTCVHDGRKGERLAVLHTLDPALLPEILRKVQAAGLPNLFIPRIDDFLRVDKLPILGTGKLDLRAVKRIATEWKREA